ncbi:amino acid ABC transporter substrate-binding protein [Ellagibacter isourolithinifaciens]|uniref:Amino acid ABC transporter substrate-binding protein n=1 Tax=Ellagibacter isourolithinifaciens TaxID=2137581 RepID=A0A6N6NLE0_9ACTN|nr:amino acid ABC transporter substrate-binding protein [Ellagibacter isourolithinifaciens]KAB1640371.1 amino acid ABC transporter substrate-binding protein [Ellagibacter isourolithinifaciens]
MKKLKVMAAAVCALALAACMLAGCSSNNASNDKKDAAATSSDKTTLIVGFDQSYPPYGFVGNDGNFTGFDLDLAAEVASRNGWDIQLEPIDWDAKDTLLNSGAITCIWNGFTMEGRENDYTFSDPYMLNAQVIVVKKGSGIESLADLAGKNVLTQTDSAAYDVLAGDEATKADLKATFASLDTIGEYNTAFMQLESGAVDAVACDLSIAQYQMSAKPDAYVQLPEDLSDEHYAVGVKKGNTELADAITKTLKEMNEDGTVEKLCEKYAEYGLSYTNWILK